MKKNTLAAFIVLSGLVAVSFAGAQERPLTSSGLQRPEEIQPAPPFLLKDLDGKERRLDDYRGRVIVVHFWATWCAPCQAELPTLRALWERYRNRGLVVVAIAADSKKAVLPFTKEHGLSFPVLMDQYGSALRAYRAWALPASYVVGKAGTIEWIALGSRDWTGPEVTGVIAGLLKE